MQTQARICPVCIDDHSEFRECKRKDLIERIATLRAEIEGLTGEVDAREMCRNAAHAWERTCNGWQTRAEQAERERDEARAEAHRLRREDNPKGIAYADGYAAGRRMFEKAEAELQALIDKARAAARGEGEKDGAA